MGFIRLTLAIVLLAIAFGCKPDFAKVGRGQPAPDFVLNDINGTPVKLSDFRGKFVLLEFWATWCPPCKTAIAELNDLQSKQLDEEFVILSISVDDDISTVQAFMEYYYIEYPVLFDDQGVSDTYAAYQIPTTVVIGKDGTILKHHLGFGNGVIEELLREAMDEYKKGEQSGIK